jgi:hypothetical protein
MTTVTPPSTNFVRRVRKELAAQDLTIRGLARRMDPDNLNRARRNLHRWLDEGISPSMASRAEVAVALGIAEVELSDDDEEDHLNFGAAMQKLFDRAVEAKFASLQQAVEA